MLYLLFIIVGAVMLTAILRSPSPAKTMAFSCLSGLMGLGAVHLSGLYFVQVISLSPLTIGASAVLGLPGVIGMLALRLAGLF